MSKRERTDGKLDLRPFYGIAVAATALGSLAWVLVRHKQLSDKDKLAELTKRNSARILGLANKIHELEEKLADSSDKAEREWCRDLILEAKKHIAELQSEASLPLSIQLTLEQVREAAAVLDHAVIEAEESINKPPD